jgi:hypothetical protein
MNKIVQNDDFEFNFLNKMHIEFLLDNEHIFGFSNLFYGQYWNVHISKCDRLFVTSDSTVAVILPPRQGIYGPTFLERTHIFPLTPRIAIEARYPDNESGKKLNARLTLEGVKLRLTA